MPSCNRNGCRGQGKVIMLMEFLLCWTVIQTFRATKLMKLAAIGTFP